MVQSSTIRKSKILRPRTAYNFFYRDQRAVILNAKLSLLHVGASVGKELEKEHKNKSSHTHKSKGKRSHRKTHGLISLEQLTKAVAKQWREASLDIREEYRILANKDKIRYTKEMISSINQKRLDKVMGTTHEEIKSPQGIESLYDKKIFGDAPDLVNSNEDSVAYLSDLSTGSNETKIHNYTDFLGITWSSGELDALRSLSMQ